MKNKYLNNNNRNCNHLSKPVSTKKPFGFNSNWFLTFATVVFISLYGNKTFSQVSITKPNLSIPVCSGFPSSYFTLGNIVITETANSNFSNGTNQTLILTAPTNFEFLANSALVTVTGNNISLDSFSNNNTTITIQYDISNTNRIDFITIASLQIRAINIASTGNITRTGGTAIINGLVNTNTLTNTLTSTSGTTPSAIGGGSATVCTGLTTPAFTNATAGGTWSITPGTGTASITTGGVVTGGTAGTVNVVYTVGICSVTRSITVNTNPAVIGGGAATVCTGLTTPAFTNVNAGGTWSITPGTGTASITSGGVVTGVTAGTVTVVYTLGTCSVTRALTVNQTPAAMSGGSSTVCTGLTTPAFTNATAGGTWSISPGTGSATITTGGIVTGGTAGTVTVVYTLGTCTPATVILNVITVPSTTITPIPATGATGICYSGVGAINNVSWAATATATSYDVYFGAGSLPGTVTANVPINSYTTGTLLPSTTYFWRIVAKNACGNAASSATWTFTTAAAICTVTYCIPTGNLDCIDKGDYIANVTFNTLNNNTTCNAGGFTVFAATGTQTTTVARGNTYNLSVGTGIGNKKHGLAAWIDFNQNGLFDTTEYFFFGNNIIANSINTLPVLIPAGASLGTTRMRIRYSRKTDVSSTSSCIMTGNEGETEDYTITIINALTCVAPTTQPTALILNPTGTTIAGSFTAPIPAPNNYLVVINTTNTIPTPINGTTYTIGGTIGAGNIVVDNDSNVAFVASGLTASTTYYIFIFAFNSACTGGPAYNLTSPLSGTSATIGSNYCIPSVTSLREDDNYISEVSFIGTLNDVSNNSTFSSAPLGYQNFTNLSNLSRQAQGEGVNVFVQALYTSFIKAWVDWNKDGLFDVTTELVYNSAGLSAGSTTFGFIIPSSQALGNYRLRIRVDLNGGSGSTTFNSCGNLNNGGETEDYLFTVVANCNSIISTITDGKTCSAGTVSLTASSTSPGVSQYRWYSTPTGNSLVGTSPTGSWTTPSISNTTTYYVTAFNGCESLVRTAINAVISPLPTLTYSPTNPTVCGEDVVIALNATGDLEEVFLIDEKFTSGLGTFTNTNVTSSSQDSNTQWQNKLSTFVPTPIPGVNTWYPAISTGINGNGFAFSTSDFGNITSPNYVHNFISSATLNTTNFINLYLSLRMYFSRYYMDETNLSLEFVTIDVSTNGGSTWTELKRFTEEVGIGTKFETFNFDLSAYVNQSNLKVRVRYFTNQWCDGLAVDDIKLYGNRPIGTALSWTSTTPVAAFSDAACTLPYVANTPAIDVYVKPTLAQLEQGTYTFTANAILDNGCTTSQIITVTNNSKVWKGTSVTNWQNATDWKPDGVPTADNCVIIPNTTIIPGGNYQAFAKNLTVKPTGNLDITSGSNLTVTDFVKVNPGGIFTIKNSASLIQINDSAINIGNISMNRTTNIRQQDYVYWSSPVENFSAASVSPGTPSGLIYKWNPTIANTNGGFGNWVNGNEIMNVGTGYIIRGPSSFNSTVSPYNATFTGVPYNGIKQPNISRGNVTTNSIGTNGIPITNLDDNWNLLGNPYPSAIDAKDFLILNTNINGNVRLWTHNSLISATNVNPFYGSFSLNYSQNDYVSFNGTGSTPPGFNGKIGAGQSFFVVMNDGAASTSTIRFNNSLRSNTYNNSQFYRSNSPENESEIEIEKDRIWVSIVSPGNNAATTLIGYVDGATDNEDRLYDAVYKPISEVGIYSILNDKTTIIQGRQLPFDDNDFVPLGITIPSNGLYTIGIGQAEGLFINTNQSIYLEDTYNNIIHDLRALPYSFQVNSGRYDDRFVLRYKNESLDNPSFNENETLAYINNHIIKIQSKVTIKEIKIFDMTGKLITTYNVNGSSSQYEDNFPYTNGVYLAVIKHENDSIVKRKLLN